MGLKEDLINIVGPEWVSDDPALVYCYTRTFVTDAMRPIWPYRKPIYVVCPGSIEEIVEIVRVANKYGVHVQVIGGGQGLSSPMWTLRASGGIIIDPKRITILDIDEANRFESVYCGVYSASRSGEWKKRLERREGGPWRPFFTGGPGQSIAVSSNLLGGQKFGLWKHNVAWFTLTSLQIVLPDGTVLDTGSKAVVGIPEFWPYGPGPTLHFALGTLGGNVAAALGIVTKISFKLYPVPEAIDGAYAFYNDVRGVVEAIKEFAHRELFRGVFVGCDWTMAAYSADSRTSSQRLSRASALYQLGVASWGTKRRVEHELKVFRDVVKRTGGRLMPRELMRVYRGHNFNILGWSQSNSPREYRHLGSMGSNPAYAQLDPDAIERYITWGEMFVRMLPGYMDHSVYGKNIGLYSSGLQIYVYQYGHGGCDLEYIWSYDLRNPLHLGGIMGFIFAAHAMSLDAGVYQERMAEEYAWSSHGALYDFLKKIKLEFDPNYITGAGIAFDKALK
jgi:FAD/FMN-containing dehydrogenase